MVRGKVILNNFMGLHIRPANILCCEAIKFDSSITLLYNEAQADAKSLFSLLQIGVKEKSEIEIICDGPDETDALEKIILLINNGLGE